MPAQSRCPYTRMKALLSFKQLEEAISTGTDLAQLRSLVSWIVDFVAQPHKDVGRQGPVCPFMPRALNSDTLQFADVRTKNMDSDQLDLLVKSYAEVFLNTTPTQGKARLNKAIVLTLQDIELPNVVECIEGTQRRLKGFFVDRGLMLGEFHATHQGRGIRNDSFFPLQSPVPLLVIRHMIPSDLPFLVKTSDPPKERLKFLAAYAREFFLRVSADTRDEFNRALIRTMLELLLHAKRDSRGRPTIAASTY
jgi:hypothetical protein